MKKYWLIVVALTCCLITLAGCGAPKTSTSEKNAPNEDATTSATAEDKVMVRLNGVVPSKKQADTEEDAIQALVYQWNKQLLTTLFSGEVSEWPQRYCENTDIYQALNDLLQQTLASKGTIGKGVTDSYFNVQIEELRIGKDIAKVVVTRTADVHSPQLVQYGQEEGYVLKKIDGQWKINNILLSSENNLATFKAFKHTTDLTDIAIQYAFDTLPPTTTGPSIIPKPHDPTSQTH